MSKRPIILTGAQGFIGSNLVAELNRRGYRPIIFTRNHLGERWRNLAGLSFDLIGGFADIPYDPIAVHLGANVSTTEVMSKELWDNNVTFTLDLQRRITERGGRFIYASSASVYGNDASSTERIDGLKPLNAYAMTKWQLDNAFFGGPASLQPTNTCGLRFFNCYGPGESFKGDMASVIYKGLNKLAPLYSPGGQCGERFESPPHWSLFKSHLPIQRDFVYVADVAKVICHFVENEVKSGVYNVGSGRATTFEEVMKAIDPAMDIKHIDIPTHMKAGYQHRSCADLTNLRAVAGYTAPFLTVEEGIKLMRETK